MTTQTVPATMPLGAHSLLSKWGFYDGDCPDFVLDALAPEWNDPRTSALIGGWHDMLRALVRTYLLPALVESGFTVETYDIGTNHNPIRAKAINGRELPDNADHEDGWWTDALPDLAVEVPLSVIALMVEDARADSA